ncbi:MAG: ThiF family adenylyltransferase [Kiritimatiellae bacterium]|nr:ThiF family adenylyltransferase [Kiritimatiellia bacterium]
MERKEALGRLGLLVGERVLDALASVKVAVFGVGGVGGWCAESLARSGVGRLMLVDFDDVCASNLNRQIMATSATIGQPKVEALARRLGEIAPFSAIDARRARYSAETADSFALEEFDYVIDAIDSLDAKAALIRHALSLPGTTLFSSMGAALKMDSLQIRATDFRKVEGDGLARALRTRLRKSGGIPERRFTCVWSPERRENKGECSEGRANGSAVHVTAAFGLALAGLVVADVERKASGTV